MAGTTVEPVLAAGKSRQSTSKESSLTLERALSLLQAVADRQAELIARWLGVGFIHGVMNTDNMTIYGETIDFGPCAFLDEYDPMKVFSSIDRQGRYAYRNQPGIGQWNIARLAEALVPLIDDMRKYGTRWLLAEDAEPAAV